LYLLDISWGDMGIPKLELLSILHLISSLSIPYTWKLPSYKTSYNSISNVSINMILNQPFWFSFKLKHTTYKAYTIVATSSKVSWSKELKKKVIERQTQIVAEICQNRTADKSRFFRGPSLAQIEKCKNNESLDITWGICKRNRRSKRYSENFSWIFTVQHQNLFQDSNFPKSYLPQIRGSSWHNNEIKMIRRGHYSSNNFQDSNKRTSTEKKTLG
jgi:hypothetical protein